MIGDIDVSIRQLIDYMRLLNKNEDEKEEKEKEKGC